MSESLLTLNETTLYYYFLSDRVSNVKEKFSTGINKWAASIPDNTSTKVASASGRISKSSNRSQAGRGSHGSHLPALTNATSRSSTSASVLSKNIKISERFKAKAEPLDTSIEIIEIGLEDNDETIGVEREAALRSPPKGKTRVSSAVSKKI
jgi:hypothetical protein